MAEPFSAVKMITGVLSGTHWAKSLMFGLSIGFLIFVGLGVYRGYFQAPPPTTDQTAETIENYYATPKVTFGCATTKTYQKYPTNRM